MLRRSGEALQRTDRTSLVITLWLLVVSGLVGQEMLEDGEMEKGVLSAGQSMGLVKDIPTCRELLDNIMTQAEAIIKEKFAQTIT